MAGNSLKMLPCFVTSTNFIEIEREKFSLLPILKQYLVTESCCWQVFFSGVLLVLMAVGNFINTVQTLMAKSRFKAKMKRSKSKQGLH